MALHANEIAKLRRIIELAEKMIAESPKPQRGRPALPNGMGSGRQRQQKRIRRSGKELVRFRKMLKAERKRGVSAAELARKHRISTTYIYTL